METPDIRHSTYGSSSALLQQGDAGIAYLNKQAGIGDTVMAVRHHQLGGKPVQQLVFTQAQEHHQMANPPRRLVQVFIVDPSESVPLNDCLLHQGDIKMTDLTDQELFYEVDIKQLLDRHNEKRTKIVDKTVKERTEYLEPARIRDLRMQIVTVATF